MYKERFTKLISQLEPRFIEREELIRLILLALFSKKHMFLIGKPGVGKTFLTKGLSGLFEDGKYWEILMARDTRYEYLFGQMVIDENGKLMFEKEGTLIEADFVFLDEMFKGKNEILNALLQIMAEGSFSVKGQSIPVPVRTVFGASNEFPVGDEIAPFRDRLLFWYDVLRIQDRKNFEKLITDDFVQGQEIEDKFRLSDIDDVVEASKKVAFPRHVIDLYIRIKENIIKDGIEISDRKFKWIVEALRVAAVLNDRDALNISDLLLMQHMLWSNYTDKRKSKEVLYDTMFNSRIQLMEALQESLEGLDRNKSKIDANLKGVLSYNRVFEGKSASQDFDIIHDEVVKSLEEIKYVSEDFAALVEVYNHKIEIEKEIDDNITLYNCKSDAFTNEMYEQVLAGNRECSKYVGNMQAWVAQNNDSYEYTENFLSRRAR